MPTVRKPAEQRQNRITKDVGVVQRPSSGLSVAADEGWRESTVERWVGFWASPLSEQVEQSDLGSLRRLFYLYDELGRMIEAIEQTGRVVPGSQGQPRPNPLYKQVESFQAEARQLEDRFGLSPRARLQLGISFAAASSSLDALNERLAAKLAESDGLWDEG